MAKPLFEDTMPIESQKPAFEDTSPLEAEEPSMAEKIETAARSALEGATFGVSEPAISGINAVVGNLISAGFNAEDVGEFVKQAASGEAIKQEYQRDIARRKALEAEMPGLATAAEIGGAIASPAGPIGRGVTALGKGIAAAAGRAVAPALEVTKAAEALPAVAKIAKGATEAGAQALAGEAVKQAVEMPTGFMETGTPLKEVGVTGAGLGAALSAIPVAGKAISGGAAKTLSAFGGVKEKVIKDYLKRSEPMLPVSVEALKDTTDAALQRVQAGLVEQRKQAADDILLAVKALKDRVIKGSQESFEILEKEGVSTAKTGKEKVIKASEIIKSIDEQIAAQKTKVGDILLNDVRQKAAAELERLKGTVTALSGEIGDSLDLVTAKEIIRSLDEVTQYAKSTGEWTGRLDQALQAVRFNINQQLRGASKAYAQKMDEVSKDVKLLEAADDLLGNEAKALSGVQTLAVGKNPRLNALADQLQSATGVKISRGIEAIKKTTPVQRMDPKTTESFLKGVMGGRSIEGRRTLQMLSELADEDLVRLADDAAMSAEFEKVVQNGSRDVNFWKEIMGGLTTGGALAGGALGGPGGAMMGAGVGYLVKTFGAPTTKVILDGVIKVRGIPTVKKLNAALSSVPAKTREQLVNGFVRSTIVGMEKDEPMDVQIPEENRAEIMEDIKGSDMDSVAKVKALQSLQKSGSIKTETIKRYMVGQKPGRVSLPAESRRQELKMDKPDILKALEKRNQK
jgi:hypothetical protein